MMSVGGSVSNEAVIIQAWLEGYHSLDLMMSSKILVL